MSKCVWKSTCLHQRLCVFKGLRDSSYHLLVWFDLIPLALSCFLDVFGRQPSDRGRVLVVAPELTDLMLTVQRAPQVPVQTMVVEMMSDEMSATPKAKVITFILQTKQKPVHCRL